MHGFIGEFFGTMVLILLGAGCCAGNSLNKTYGKQSGWWFICISWGLAVTMGVYVAGFLGSSGHLNPAVTIPLLFLAYSHGVTLYLTYLVNFLVRLLVQY